MNELQRAIFYRNGYKKYNGMYKNGQKIFSALWPHN